jgi:hypothetical protein
LPPAASVPPLPLVAIPALPLLAPPAGFPLPPTGSGPVAPGPDGCPQPQARKTAENQAIEPKQCGMRVATSSDVRNRQRTSQNAAFAGVGLIAKAKADLQRGPR